MFQWGNFIFDKEFEADGYAQLLCHLNWLWGWPSYDLRADDASFQGIAATVYGAVSANPSVEGFLNGCAYFPTGNNNDYILYADHPALQITTALTMECIVSPSKLSGTRTLMEKTGSYRLYFIDGSPNVTLGFTITIGGLSKTLTATVAESSFYYYWNHIKATYDGQKQRLYFNCTEAGNRTQTGLIDISANPFCVGRKNDTGNQPYKGFIDEIRISNIVRPFIGSKKYDGKTALSGTKVQNLYQGKSALKRGLLSLHEGQSRLKKRSSLVFGGQAALNRPHLWQGSGRSVLGKVISSSFTGHAKLAFFTFEVNLSNVVKDSFKVLRRPLGEIGNKGHFLYQKNYRARSFAGAITQEDQESQSRYGIREKTVEFNFVREASVAAELAAYYFGTFKEVGTKINFRTFLTGLHLEVGDHILVNYPLYNFTGELFTITGIKFLPGSGQKRQVDQVAIEAEEG